LNDKHVVRVYDLNSGKEQWSDNGDTNKIFDLTFTKKSGSNIFVTVGTKHIKFWDPSSKTSRKGIFGNGGPATSFAVAAFDENGICYSGGANSQVYVWKGNNLSKTLPIHSGGFISAMTTVSHYLVTGAKDN
jgi:hypothetical protein